MKIESRRDIVFLVLTGFFITNAILAEVIGVKLILFPLDLPLIGQPAASVGVILWPIVFLSTDLINEYFGRDGVRRLTLMTILLISYAFVILLLAIQIPAASFSPVQDEAFQKVFGQSLWIIVGSLVAFAISQLIDVSVFWFFRQKTDGKMLWLRATGSTVISQFVDSFVIIGIAFWLPGKIETNDFFRIVATNYSYKLLIAISLTPFIYLLHNIIDRYLGYSESSQLIETAAKNSLLEVSPHHSSKN